MSAPESALPRRLTFTGPAGSAADGGGSTAREDVGGERREERVAAGARHRHPALRLLSLARCCADEKRERAAALLEIGVANIWPGSDPTMCRPGPAQPAPVRPRPNEAEPNPSGRR